MTRCRGDRTLRLHVCSIESQGDFLEWNQVKVTIDASIELVAALE